MVLWGPSPTLGPSRSSASSACHGIESGKGNDGVGKGMGDRGMGRDGMGKKGSDGMGKKGMEMGMGMGGKAALRNSVSFNQHLNVFDSRRSQTSIMSSIHVSAFSSCNEHRQWGFYRLMD